MLATWIRENYNELGLHEKMKRAQLPKGYHVPYMHFTSIRMPFFLPRNTLVVHNFSKDIQDEFKLLNPKVRIPSVAPLWDFPFMQECPVDAWLVFDGVLVVCGLTTAANASSSLRPLSISWRRIWPFDCLGKKIF